MEEKKSNGNSAKDEANQPQCPGTNRVSDRNSNNSQTLWSIMPKNSRKRKRNQEQEDVSGAEGTDTEETEDTIKPNTSTEPASPSTSSSRRVRRKKRKHHSHPKQKERNVLPTESDSLVYSTANNAPNSSNNSAAGNRSSISDSEDFELLDEFSNLYASARLLDRPAGSARPIAIDGCNVAWGHGNDQEFSYKGIILCADYFRARGHNIVKAFVPRQHQHLIPKQVVEEMTRDEILVFTPSRKLGNQGKRISSYDDRFIVQYAVLTGGIVISNDNFQDLYNEQPAWRETIASRVLQHTWISKDILMFPLDPLGRKGKTLDEFLHFPQQTQQQQPQSSTTTMTPTTSVSAAAAIAGSSESNTSNLSATITNKSVSWKSLKKIDAENVDESETDEE